MEKSPKPLRILAIVNLPWDARLGAARVWIELAEEWTRAGHVVEKFCLTDAFPAPTSSNVRSTLRTALFPYRAAAFVRRHGARFDVIDCLIGTLPFSKKSLGYRGLLVARSVGLYRLYEDFLRLSRTRWPDQPKGRFFGRIFHGLVARHLWRQAEASVRVCDLINVPNESESRALESDPVLSAPAVVQPYGLSDRFREALARAAVPPAERLLRQKICFIGMWSLRKGSRDWAQIMQGIWARHPAVEFVFLGTMVSDEVVHADLGCDQAKRITCLPTYQAADLPALLADATLGLFPSYVEGFGLAVIEQLAAGLPTVAYDVAGPQQILAPESSWLLTPPGDPAAMAARASEILALPLEKYERLAAACLGIAQDYRWSQIAAATIRRYQVGLDSLGRDA